MFVDRQPREGLIMFDARLISIEIRRVFRERPFMLAILLLTGLTLYGAWDSSRWIGEHRAVNSSLMERHESDLDERRQKLLTERPAEAGQTPPPSAGDPFSIGAGVHYASIPILGTSVLSLGQMDVLDTRVGVSLLNSTRTEAGKDSLENPWALLNGRIDVSFVVIYLLPLLILALGFSLISSEREAGTLQMILSNPISLWKFSFSKAAAHCLIAIVSVAIILPFGIYLGGETSIDVVLRWGLWLFTVFVYAVFWMGIVLFVASFRRDSSAGALYSIGLWLAFVIVIPSVMSSVVSLVFPVPSRSALISEIRAINPDLRREAEKLIGEFYNDHPELVEPDGQMDLMNRRLASVQVQLNQKRKIAEFERRHELQLSNQQRILGYFGFLSPPVMMQETFNEIAGTGMGRHVDFIAQTRRHAEEWDAFFMKKVSGGIPLTPPEFDQIPRFSYREEDLSVVVKRITPGIGLTMLLSAGLVFLSRRRLSSSRVLE